MPLPIIGTTHGVQTANQSVAATSDATGALTFTGPSGIQGSTITCNITVPNAPGNAIFTATLGTIGGQGVVVDTWGGESTAGPFQIGVGQTLVVTGSGLALNTQYTCTFSQITDVGDVQAVLPAPNSSAQVAQSFSQVGVDVLPNTITGAVAGLGTTTTVTAQRAYQTLIISTSLIASAASITFDLVNLTQAQIGSVFIERGNLGGNGHINAAIPIVCKAGDVLRIHMVGSAPLAFTANVYGVTTAVAISPTALVAALLPADVPVRPDGRPYPAGVNVYSAFPTATGTLVAAPGVGARFLLKRASIFAAAAGANATIKVTVNGTSYDLVGAFGALGAGEAMQDESGLLLDDNTAITLSFGAANACKCTVVYDVVA